MLGETHHRVIRRHGAVGDQRTGKMLVNAMVRLRIISVEHPGRGAEMLLERHAQEIELPLAVRVSREGRVAVGLLSKHLRSLSRECEPRRGRHAQRRRAGQSGQRDLGGGVATRARLHLQPEQIREGRQQACIMRHVDRGARADTFLQCVPQPTGKRGRSRCAWNQVERRLLERLVGVLKLDVHPGLLGQNEAAVSSGPGILVMGQNTNGFRTTRGERLERQAIQPSSEAAQCVGHRLGRAVGTNKAQLPLDAKPVIGRLRQMELVIPAPPQQRVAVVRPQREQVRPNVVSRYGLAADHRTKRAHLLGQARFSSDVGVEARFGRGMHAGANRIDRIVIAVRRK